MLSVELDMGSLKSVTELTEIVTVTINKNQPCYKSQLLYGLCATVHSPSPYTSGHSTFLQRNLKVTQKKKLLYDI